MLITQDDGAPEAQLGAQCGRFGQPAGHGGTGQCPRVKDAAFAGASKGALNGPNRNVQDGSQRMFTRTRPLVHSSLHDERNLTRQHGEDPAACMNACKSSLTVLPIPPRLQTLT